ncbi:putative ABC transporter substrate binding protein [Gordonia araii NBRC 100433]|uniref:Putative ABC transporter substrate binding protein n=1 Tax=Gordonia araii NBRC 100433 TaxID=1073574 RepID=G7H414_9ACTN|nr:ABC transporter substrate-binding protein [Gordonia araii]NNG96346.1 ABC transporter substrate-binding protein [Gordonia araii NBRC 100433]GAB10589.1 putative ABC transporter substrate binding protein [Gordonia araii NBRC 100433]
MSGIGVRTIATVIAAGIAVGSMAGCVESGRPEQSRTIGGAVKCPVDPDPSVTGTVRIAWQEIPNGDLVVKDAGLLETCLPKAKLVWSKFASGGDVIQAFGANSLDIGLLGSAPAAKALSAPLDIAMRILWIQDQIGQAESLIARDPAIKTVADLRGKRIGVPFASTAHYSLLTALDKAGVGGSAQVLNLSPDAIRGAWQGGQIDAAYIWEPTLDQLKSGGAHVVTDNARVAEQGAPTYDLTGARSDFVAKNSRFLRIWAAAQNWAAVLLNTKPDEAAVHIAGQLGVPVEQVLTQIKGYRHFDAAAQAAPDRLGGQLGADLRNTAQFLLQQGQVDAVGPVEAYIAALYPDAAREVAGR